MSPGLDLYYTAQHLITAGEDQDNLYRDVSDLSDLSEVYNIFGQHAQ